MKLTKPSLLAVIFLGSFILVTNKVFAMQRVSVDNFGIQGNGDSSISPGINSMSSDGRYVVFVSSANNLVPGDTNAVGDVFVYDRNNLTTIRVSIDSLGHESNGPSIEPGISTDGRYVTFTSNATNLVPGDTNNSWDIFVHDLVNHTTERVSVDSQGIQGNNDSFHGTISTGGRYVAFQSDASNLVANDTNNTWDIFVYERATHIITRVSVNSLGIQSNGPSEIPAIASDGLFVSFSSVASNLITNDTNSMEDVFVYNRITHTTEIASINNMGVSGNLESKESTMSADGRYVAFYSRATNLVSPDSNNQMDVYVYDRTAHTIEKISVNNMGIEGDGASSGASISSDGKYVVFASGSTNFATNDTNGQYDIFSFNRTTHTIKRISEVGGLVGNSFSLNPSISGNGNFISFYSIASNLVPNDNNLMPDVFVSDNKKPFAINPVASLSVK